MTNWFYRYGQPDMWVGVVADAQRTLEEKLGIPAGQPRRMTMFGTAMEIAYVNVNDDYSLGASHLHIMGMKPQKRGEPENDDAYTVRNTILAYVSAQRLDRPIVTHVQALQTPTAEAIQELAEKMDSKGVPYQAKLGNLYVGVAEDDQGRLFYDPKADAGLMLEFGPGGEPPPGKYPNIFLPARVEDGFEPTQVPSGTMVRVTGRTQLVKSADAVIDRLRYVYDWPEEGDLEIRDYDGYRCVTLKPIHPLSAVWDFVEPRGTESRAAKVMERYGEGPWTNRVGVFGLEDKLEDLDRRGTRWEWIDDGPSGRRVALNRWDLQGLSFELEELPEVIRGKGTSSRSE